jgi:predicted permease
VSPTDVPRLDQAGIDWRVLGFTLVLGVASSVIFGLLPAVRAAGPQLQGTLREGGRDSASTRDRLRGVLVAAEVALAITLLVGSGLLIRSALMMQRVAPGFDPRGVLTSRLILPGARYPTPELIERTYRSIRDEAARIPGVKSAALVSVVPLSHSNMNSSVHAEDQPKTVRPGQANVRQISSGYFATMGMPLIAGRDVSEHDGRSDPEVVVINEALAKLLWPNLDPRETIGKRLEAIADRDNEFREVVGVVGNVHDAALSQPPLPELYLPFEQTPDGLWPMTQRSLVVVVRAMSVDTRAESLIEPLRHAVTSVDPSLPLADKVTMESYLHDSMQTARMSTILLSTLGGIALVLAMIGIYGVVSYFVSQRTREIGLRMALGATPRAVWTFVVNRGLRPIIAGLVLGVALSLATTNVLRGQLYGVTPRDPFTLTLVGMLLLLIALLAMYIPARRAMRVAPIVALNQG